MDEIYNVERDVKGIPCIICNGYSDQVEVTRKEIREHQTCGRTFACCIGAYVCRICKRRFIAHYNAPDFN